MTLVYMIILIFSSKIKTRIAKLYVGVSVYHTFFKLLQKIISFNPYKYIR